ncbi:glycosyltransferase family 87 protein [Jatrophihabitans endophyticus]|uniref:glycosyltransferase family 87 protein n=1 Tax=Jatrophihabitans endophyticus TaxID=1206085 RepID=UPI0026F0E77E|nr:glycosyltransferase family 87 protein [Jatrophihabitans endophyticus]
MTARRAGQLGWSAAALRVVIAVDLVAYTVFIRSQNLGTARLLEAISSVCWVAGVVLLARLQLARRLVAVIVLGGGLLLGLVALTAAPSTSTDEARYIWDGKVQLAGVDPYRYTPASPALIRLRDPSLFGAPDHCHYHFPGGCTSINRPTVHTVYPPVAEGAFTAVRAVSFGRGGRLPMQVAALLGSLVIGWLLLRWGGARGRPWIAAVWMWCPTVLTELVNNAHIDWLGVLLIVLAYATPLVRRPGWAGALVGAAVVTKLYPVLALPSLMRRRPVLTVASALAVVVLVYVPHVIAVGSAVIGYLPGYLQEENYSSGSGLRLIGLLVPHPYDTALGVVIVGAVGVWAWLRGDPAAPERSAVLVVGVALLAFTPNYGWYMAPLVALVAMSGAWEWVPLCVIGTFAYLGADSDARWWFLAAAVSTVVLAVVRRRLPAGPPRRSSRRAPPP